MSERPLVAYEPNPALAWLYGRFFAHVEVDTAWAEAVRASAARGTVVYVLRNLSFIDFFALDHLTKRLELPQVRFANDLGLWVLEPMGRGWFQALRPRTIEDDAKDLRRAVESGASAALFLKRPPTALSARARGQAQGDAFIRTLFELQRAQAKPILLVPQVFVWSKNPDAAQHSAVDALLGPREWPGKIRTIAQFAANYRHVTLRAGEPVDLATFLAQEGRDRPDDDVLVRRLTYTLLRRLERERHTVLGPTRKPADRLREEVLRSPKLQKIVRDMAGEGERERDVIRKRALDMIAEMEASLDINAVAVFDKAFEGALTRMYSSVEVDQAGLERLRAASKDATLILLPSHKSHVDYMVLSHLFYRNHLQLPLIAAGDNLNFFPMGPLFRKAGAFFIRRSFRADKLYTAVVDAYVRRLLKDGWSLEFFLEGGRSRSGKLLPPKVGILTMVVDAALGVQNRRVLFCPISIGYERVAEEKAFVSELTGGEKKKEDASGLLATAGIMAGRYGRLNVQFGEFLTLEGVLREIDPAARPEALRALTPPRRRAVITRLAHRVMHEINHVTAVTPGALVATALLTHGGRGLAHGELVAACGRLAASLRRFGARFTPSLAEDPDGIREGALIEAVDLFARAGHLEILRAGAPLEAGRRQARPGPDAVYVVPESARLSLDLSKNILVHFFVPRAILATALMSSSAPPTRRETVRERAQSLSRLLKYEFSYRADGPFEQIFSEELQGMVDDGELALTDADEVTFAGDGGRHQVELYTRILRNFVEGYRVAARGLSALLRGPMTAKDLVKRSITLGERMFLAGEIACREAVSALVLENALLAFVDQGYVTRSDGKLMLPESLASAEAVATVEGKLENLLRGPASSPAP